MTVLLTDLITTIPQQPNAQPGVLSQQVPVAQLASALGTTGGPQALYTAVSGNTPATLTGPQMAGAQSVYINMTAALAAAGTLNTAAASAILAAIPNPAVGLSYELRIINSSSGNFAWTLTAGANVTVTGTATIAQNTFRDFVVTLTSATAVSIQSVGTGSNS